MSKISGIAEALRAAEKAGKQIAPIREQIKTADEAYQVQEINTSERLNAGGRLIGRKIGLTNKAVQAQLGVDQPDYGMLFADMDVPHGGELPWVEGAQFKVEAEISFVLGRDLENPDAGMAEVLRAIEYAVPSLEIVGSRIQNWDIHFVDTVADNASSAFFTLGPCPKKIDVIDLLNCKMTLSQDGETISEGSGRACLGSPLNAVQWLARIMAKSGRPLAEGDVVLSGALGPMAPVAPGAAYAASIEGLGETAIAFAKA